MVGHALLHKSVDPIESSQVSHGLTSFLSTGPCRSIESQQNADEHWLARQSHWQWRSQGLVLGTEGLWLQASERWKKMESSGVPVVFETYDTCWWTWFSLTFFCPQALAEALKVNKTVTTIDLSHNGIGKEGAKAWCLARRVCGSRLRNDERKWNQVVYRWCSRLVKL